MTYSELCEIRAKKLWNNLFLTLGEYLGTKIPHYPVTHVHWYSVCVDQRNDHWKCEQCGQYDSERCPAKI